MLGLKSTLSDTKVPLVTGGPVKNRDPGLSMGFRLDKRMRALLIRNLELNFGGANNFGANADKELAGGRLSLPTPPTVALGT